MFFCKEMIIESRHFLRGLGPAAVPSLLRQCGTGLVLVVFCCSVGLANNNSQVEKVRGTVIAYDYVKSITPCYKGRCEASLIVRIDANQPEFIRVNFQYSEGRAPRQLVQRSRQWSFHLVRTSDLDEPIDEVIKYGGDGKGNETVMTIWKSIPGAESEKLPFGEVLRSYSLPKNGFKAVGKN